MSRVHDALRKAEQGGNARPKGRRPGGGLSSGRSFQDLLQEIREVPFTPAPESYLIDPNRAHDSHSEEFRTLRTRLNHLQKLQPIHSVVISSPSPAEGKSFTAVNLALAFDIGTTGVRGELHIGLHAHGEQDQVRRQRLPSARMRG